MCASGAEDKWEFLCNGTRKQSLGSKPAESLACHCAITWLGGSLVRPWGHLGEISLALQKGTILKFWEGIHPTMFQSGDKGEEEEGPQVIAMNTPDWKQTGSTGLVPAAPTPWAVRCTLLIILLHGMVLAR